MSERLKGFVVTLKEDIREDDAPKVIHALQMIKGVLRVDPICAKHDDLIIENRIKSTLRESLWAWGDKYLG